MESPKLKMQDLIRLPNIAEKLSKDYLENLGKKVLEDYHIDLDSRAEWERRNRDAIKLALQVVEKKTTPFVGASNVKFPLITIAALQFLSRISILTRGRKIVQCDVLGVDNEGKEHERAKRISAHMSYQLVEEDVNWIDDDERTKFSTAIIGSGFKKTYHDNISGQNNSEFVPAYNFVVDYYTKYLDGKGRSTHVIPMSENDILERVRVGTFLKDDSEHQNPMVEESNVLKEVRDKAQGVNKSPVNEDTPSQILEQYRWEDLDGDGFKEPYIVSVRQSTGSVLRVVANYYDEGDVHRVRDHEIQTLKEKRIELISNIGSDMESFKSDLANLDKRISEIQESKNNHIVRIDPTTYFTKYVFLPSPDGGFYGLGLGSLLGPVNAAVDTGINQLIDAATLSIRSGGVLGRGVKLKSGPLELDKWTPIDSNGDDIRKNVMQWPVREPSPILFQLIQLLISYGERITGATDIMTGVAPGQNTPAETSRNTIEQGMKIFSGIYQRMHRSFQEELRKLYRLNSIHMMNSAKFFDLSNGKGAIISLDDYRKGDVIVKPAADPSNASDAQRQQKAIAVEQSAMQVPGYNMYKVQKNKLEAFDIQNIDELLPDPSGPKALPPPKNPKVQIEEMKTKVKQSDIQRQAKKDEFEMAVKKFELQQEVEMQEAQILKMLAEVDKLRAEAKGVETGHQIALIEAQIGAARTHRESILKAIDVISRQRKERDGQEQKGMADTTRDAKVSPGDEKR